MYPKWCPNPLNMYLQIAILFCSVFLSFLGALKSQNMCLGHACAVQITLGTNHMAHDKGGQRFSQGTQIHEESMTRTSLLKDMRKSGTRLDKYQKQMSPKWFPKGCIDNYILLLGASWGSFGAPIDILMQKMNAKSSQNDDNRAKVTPKDTPQT